MKVQLRGNDNPSENFKKVIDILNNDYASLGVKVKNATLYIRFEDENGNTVDIQENGLDIEREFNFSKVVDIKDFKKSKKNKETKKGKNQEKHTD